MLLKKIRPVSYGVAALIYAASPFAYAGKTIPINVDPNGKLVGDVNISNLSISADGRYVAFASSTPNLVAEDSNKWMDVFVRDLLNGKTTRVSINSKGSPGNNDSYEPIISADGRYVVFNSNASNLVDNDTNEIKGDNIQDVFVHDTATKQTTRVSVSSTGVQGDSYSTGGDISADGRYVAFTSTAKTLVTPDSNGYWEDIFIHDRTTGQTTRVSVSSKGLQGDRRSLGPSLSADGRYVAFLSNARNLVPKDTNLTTDVFVHDRLQKKTTLESVSSKGVQGSVYWNLQAWQPEISADGSKVVFMSDATKLVPNDKNKETDIFVRDRAKKQTVRANISSEGVQAMLMSLAPEISADGRYVGFTSAAYNLIRNDKYTNVDAFVHDLVTRQTTLASTTNNGLEQSANSSIRDISADGRYAVFVSTTNAKTYNAFVRDRLLDTKRHADLKISLDKKIDSLKPNTQGNFTYTITNNGPHAVKDVSLLHLLSEPNTTVFKASQGKCSVAAVETICHLGKLATGKTLSLQVTVDAKTHTFTQKLSVSSEAIDSSPSNNTLAVVTQVKTSPGGGGGYGGEEEGEQEKN